MVGLSGRLKQTAAAAAVILALMGGHAQAAPEPPAESDIAFRIQPMPGYATTVERQALEDHPLFRVIQLAGSEILGIEPLRFMDATFEGTVVGAILSKPGPEGTSSLKEFLQDRKLRERWKSDVDELQSLARDLEDYRQTTEAYPEDLQQYLDEVRYYEPYLSDGVSYRYQVLNDGQDYRLTMVFAPDSQLDRLGDPPVFSSQEGYQHLEPVVPPPPLNYVVGAKIKRKDRLVKVLDQHLGSPRNGFWQSPQPSQIPMVVTIRGDWVVVSDRMNNLGDFLKTLAEQKPGWSANPHFKTVARNIEVEGPFTFFVDAPRLLAALDAPLGGQEARLVSLVGPVGYSLVPFKESQFRLEMFAGVEPPEGSELARFFAESGEQTASSDLVVSNLPWDVSNAFALHYGNTKQLLDSVIALFPELEMQFDMGQDVMMGMLGLDAQAGFDGLLEGPAIVSFERIDLFANAFESMLTRLDQSPAESPDKEMEPGEVEPEDEEEAIEPPAPVEPAQRQSPLAYVPATFALQVPIESNRQALANLLKPSMGEATTHDLYGVEIHTSEDGRVSYAIDDKWLYLSGGRTDRLMRHMLEASHGRKQSLASIDSWSRFTLSSRGRLLGFGHQKVDAIYSIAKGFLLLLGSEFRPLAIEIGKLRDYHSVITAVPDGILVTGEMLQGDER